MIFINIITNIQLAAVRIYFASSDVSLEAERCSRWGLWVQASVEQVDQQVDPWEK